MPWGSRRSRRIATRSTEISPTTELIRKLTTPSIAPNSAAADSVPSNGKGPPAITIHPPCYFNTGCCSFGDGDVTCIEIVNGDIRLVRWPDDDDNPLPKELVTAKLAEVLDLVAGRG